MAGQNNDVEQETLIRSLLAALAREDAVALFETHISWVVVAGAQAYKFKKALRFDFLDFSTLAARRFYCHEEVRLNRRLAPDLYEGVVAVTGTLEHPRIGGHGEPLEYAVKMRAFAQQALWSERIARQQISASEIDALAQKLARFHESAPLAPAASPWSSPQALQKIADDNLSLISSLASSAEERRSVEVLRIWQNEQQQKLRHVFLARKAQGRVRECHGDLHSANILTVDDTVVVFDCIEFNESLRWIDVINDLAFICMDLQYRERPGLASRLRNAYLEITGDYAALAVLRYYETELALVRWKIALLQARQGERAPSAEAQAAQYMAFALRHIKPAAPVMIIMHGYAGSGKSTVARHLVELLGAVQVRSDVERKRMRGIDAAATAASPPETGLYDRATTDAVYARLHALASSIAGSSIPVIVDATFLQRRQRRLFEHLARALGLPFFIVDVHAGTATLRVRVEDRARQGHDASDAGSEVLAYQLAHHEPLADDEKARVLAIDTEVAIDAHAVRAACAPLLAHVAWRDD